jgi:predicted kinase
MKKLVIMAGLPGSGKSTYRAERFSDMAFVDADEIKKTIPGYDPKNPATVHAQSKAIEKSEIYSMFASGTSFVYDTTATNVDKVIAMTKEAQELGYEVTVAYVDVPLHVALERNANRERVVPEEIIYDKFDKIETSMEIVKNYVDNFITVSKEEATK